MSELFTTGRIVDLILALIVLEAALVIAYHRRTRRGVTPAALMSNLSSGVFLLLALRGALVQAWWGWIALSLMAALLTHLTDLRGRWRQ